MPWGWLKQRSRRRSRLDVVGSNPIARDSLSDNGSRTNRRCRGRSKSFDRVCRVGEMGERDRPAEWRAVTFKVGNQSGPRGSWALWLVQRGWRGESSSGDRGRNEDAAPFSSVVHQIPACDASMSRRRTSEGAGGQNELRRLFLSSVHVFPQHFLNFFPLPQGQGWFRLGLASAWMVSTGGGRDSSSAPGNCLR